MKFDVIIATYNRKQSLDILVRQILNCTTLPENIIIVDSSNDENLEIQKINLVKYIYTSYGNQPYQRYLGYLEAKEDILIYFDDDMRVIDNKCFEKIIASYNVKDVVGVQPNFTYGHEFFDHQMPKSKVRQLAKKNKFFNYFKKLSGHPSIEDGKFYLAGLRGSKPANREPMEWFNGPVFSARKKYLYNNFNFNLFKLYEQKTGKAEDAILGFTLSQQGSIVYLDDEIFYHDDQGDSTYSVNFTSYGKRVAYSRLYLSFEFARLSNTSMLVAFLHYNVYILGRLTAMLINQILGIEKSRFQIMFGYLSGYFKALSDTRKLMAYKNTMDENGVNKC